MSENEFISIRIEPRDEQDYEHVEPLTRQLRQDLLELDVASVEPVPAPPPPAGSRAIDPYQIGELIIKLGASSGLLAAICKLVTSYISLRKAKGIKLIMDGDELEITGISSRDQRRAVDAWINRHSKT